MKDGFEVRLRRVYDAVEPQDGTRVLVDRLWPRGLAKETARLDEWVKDVAPSAELRRWYGHDPERFAEFGQRYRAELAGSRQQAALHRVRELAGPARLTLLTATKDLDHSHAPILAEELRDLR
ncbi:DUF488 domain-containing protein [Streptomyces gobiensis]|uniref:DUF488 domain-containing protein n=1 Tax=Streptomyces gobiensis TaxID=2875706 RepID=UPI001E2B9C21|nr:DUF488 family protein [Streptomyces gobiensis]UGY90445.1 DUF488 family protein [Streptomyces gobiensis]